MNLFVKFFFSTQAAFCDARSTETSVKTGDYNLETTSVPTAGLSGVVTEVSENKFHIWQQFISSIGTSRIGVIDCDRVKSLLKL